METIYDPYEVGWVAGILDGEGSILIIPTNYKRQYDGKPTKSARVMVAVCDFYILEKYTTILTKWGIEYGHSLQHYSPGQYNTWHDKIMIQIWKQDSVVKLLGIVSPYLTLKQGVARHVARFAQWKMDNLHQANAGGVIHPEVIEAEEQLWEEYLSKYKGKARSHDRPLSETIREKSVPLRWLN